MSVYGVAMLWMALTQDASQAQERALLLHAQGLALAQGSDPSAASGALRAAPQLAPQDRDIAFDLARLSLEVKSPQLAGGRLGVQGSSSVSPVLQGELRWDLAADVRAAFHLNDRPDLALYDTVGGSAWTTVTWPPGSIAWTTTSK